MTGVQHKVVGIGFGVAAAYVLTVGYHDPNGVLAAAASTVGCMLPDIDHDRTKIGRKRQFFTNMATTAANIILSVIVIAGVVLTALVVKGFLDVGVEPKILLGASIAAVIVFVIKKVIGDSKLFKWATKHRGLMHTLVVPAIILFGTRASDYWIYKYVMFGLFIGYMSHLFADMLTVEGCPVLFPFTTKNIRLAKFVTKDKKCTTVAYIVAILAVAAGYGITQFVK